jgi:hypothetical protein
VVLAVLFKLPFDVFFEGPLLPFHQKRSYQPEGDNYAVNAVGDRVIFELKVAAAGDSARDQLYRYAQVAGEWAYPEMGRKFRVHPRQTCGDVPLAEPQ